MKVYDRDGPRKRGKDASEYGVIAGGTGALRLRCMAYIVCIVLDNDRI